MYHTSDYDKNRNYCNHIVEYCDHTNSICVGQIKHFFKFETEIYCVIEIFTKKQIKINGLLSLQNEIDRFFVIAENSKMLEIIRINKIIRKCIKICVDSELYLTYVVDTEEHDWYFKLFNKYFKPIN